MTRRSTDPRTRQMERIMRCARSRAGDVDVNVGEFLSQYYRNIGLQDLRDRQPADLATAAIDHLKLALERKEGEPVARVYNPDEERDGWTSSHTIVDVVNDDMPFLVDSLAMVVNKRGLYIHLTVHPVMRVRRSDEGVLLHVDPADSDTIYGSHESFMHMEIDRETDPAILEEIQQDIGKVLSDVRAACEDWEVMRAKALEVCADLDASRPPLDDRVVAEGRELLEWMANDHFTFLGYREYQLVKGDDQDRLEAIPNTGLGILRNPGTKGTPSTHAHLLSREIRKQARSRELLIITKANSRATVHRPGYLDYVGVKHFDDTGRVCGEKRFLGLFTSVAYSRPPREIPVLRHKLDRVMAKSGMLPTSHGAKALQHILDTFPRDELFQSTVDELSRISRGIFELQERQQVKLLVRRDAFRRFFSCLIFVPRDRYSTQVRERVESILCDAFDGTGIESTVKMSESNLARVHIIVRTQPDRVPRFNVLHVEKHIESAVRTWHDRLKESLIERFGEGEARKLARRFADCFPAAFKEDVPPREATFDIERIASIESGECELRMSLYRPPDFDPRDLRFKLFRAHTSLPLFDVLPMLENMGLRVVSERPYCINVSEDLDVWMQDFEMRSLSQEPLVPKEVGDNFQEAFENVILGRAENDSFNRLVLLAGITWRQVAVLRAYCRYLLQTGMPFSQEYMAQVLAEHPVIARALLTKFEAHFDPDTPRRRRKRASDVATEALDGLMDTVESLDADRILSAFRAMIRATLRTNFFQPGPDGDVRDYISFKLDPSRIPNLPLPLPRFEVFVYSPRVEGVHLRGGLVARGGLRWSDRKEDFRTEVLGLMKAQAVKNTLIVPVGAKGGFVAKRLPTGGDRQAVMEEVVACYRTFIRGMLDITDNLVSGELRPPVDVVRYDDDDPYLVVAADKGTATFSDIANGVSGDYRFWLGDAFASGGSVGYDHKKMGITARGAWEAVKRHFREMGIDCQTHPFSAVGIGDMSGDVFGNGMLQSRKTRLLAAFNHMHIFLDPDPDSEASYVERERLFRLPRSSWTDYDESLISEGGGVYSRKLKVIELSGRVRDMLRIQDESLTPDELIRAILRMPVDLLWNGGIGTYVKASSESQADAGDRSNDSVRVDAAELRCKVIGEGGNLGCTQLGRVEYALKEGRMNTDFIDNSAGVDCSDREVNIKILLNLVSRDRPLTPTRRERLLMGMTDEVAALVLRNNYLQTQAISLIEAQAAERFGEHIHLVRTLEKRGELDRELEFLPDEEALDERAKAGRGFSRPELAVILSYSKLSLYNQMIQSNVPEDEYLAQELVSYFPKPLQQRYKPQMSEHRLSREIIATLVTNSLINRMGPAFAYRMCDETGADVASVARAYTISREVFEVRGLWAAIEALDNEVHANVQYSMMHRINRLLKHATVWFLDRGAVVQDIAAAVKRFRPSAGKLAGDVQDLIAPNQLQRYEETHSLYSEIGVPEDVSARMAGLQAMHAALDIIEVAQETGADARYVAGIFFQLGDHLGLDWLRDQVERLPVDGHWQAMARNSLRENAFLVLGSLTRRVVIEQGRRRQASTAVDEWMNARSDRVRHVARTLEEMQAGGPLDFPTLSVALQEIRRLQVDPQYAPSA